MTLFSAPTDPWSHRTRIVLAEKGIAIELVNVDLNDLPEDLLDLNPYHSVPTLVDRDLVLYDSRVIIEYLDERFPHPPLMPIDPVTRAQFRVALYRVERDWYGLAHATELDRERKTPPHALSLCGASRGDQRLRGDSAYRRRCGRRGRGRPAAICQRRQDRSQRQFFGHSALEA